MELNDIVSITLTKYGASFLNSENQRKRKKYISHYKELIEKTYPINYYEGQEIQEDLWVILGWFKECFYIGNDIPFTNLHIV